MVLPGGLRYQLVGDREMTVQLCKELTAPSKAIAAGAFCCFGDVAFAIAVDELTTLWHTGIGELDRSNYHGASALVCGTPGRGMTSHHLESHHSHGPRSLTAGKFSETFASNQTSGHSQEEESLICVIRAFGTTDGYQVPDRSCLLPLRGFAELAGGGDEDTPFYHPPLQNSDLQWSDDYHMSQSFSELKEYAGKRGSSASVFFFPHENTGPDLMLSLNVEGGMGGSRGNAFRRPSFGADDDSDADDISGNGGNSSA